jgi:hypothetical protein
MSGIGDIEVVSSRNEGRGGEKEALIGSCSSAGCQLQKPDNSHETMIDSDDFK